MAGQSWGRRSIGAMSSRAHRPLAARTCFARLVVLAALLAGFAVAFGVHCAEMTPDSMGDMVVSADSMAAPDSPVIEPVIADPGHDGGTGGLLMTCLVFLAAVVVAVAGLRLPWRSLPPGARPSPRPAAFRHLRPRGPRLADLCVSRT